MFKKFWNRGANQTVTEEKKIDNISEENWVRMRFWIARGENEPELEAEEVPKVQTEKGIIKKEVKNVGHVSLETSKIYASLWPDSEDTTAIGLTTQHKVFFMESPEKDELVELRPPDYIVDLFSLNVPKIEEKFEEVKTSTTKWQLMGRNKVIGQEGQSCSGQTFELLQAGGLTNQISLFNSIKPTYLYASPSNILHMAMLYKQKELLTYPEAKDFKIRKYEEEYKLISNKKQ